MAYNFQDGIYAIEENKRIVLRRLQFLRTSGLSYENNEQFEVPEFLKEEANKEISRVFYGKEVIDKSKKIDTIVNIISDNKKYPVHTVRFEDLLICGEVLWKSSNFKDNKAVKGIDLFKQEEENIFEKQLMEIA